MRLGIGIGITSQGRRGDPPVIDPAVITGGTIEGDTLSFSSDKAGTAYLTLVSSNEDTPSGAQVVAGEKADGSAAPFSDSEAITSGANDFSFDLSSVADGEYKFCVAVVAPGADPSNVLAPVETVDQTAPELQSAILAADGVTLTLAYDETLFGDPVVGEYDVEVDATSVTIDGVTISGDNVVLTLDEAAETGDTVTVSYTGSSVTDETGNEAATLTDEAVTNNSEQVGVTSLFDFAGTTPSSDFGTVSQITDGWEVSGVTQNAATFYWDMGSTLDSAKDYIISFDLEIDNPAGDHAARYSMNSALTGVRGLHEALNLSAGVRSSFSFTFSPTSTGEAPYFFGVVEFNAAVSAVWKMTNISIVEA